MLSLVNLPIDLECVPGLSQFGHDGRSIRLCNENSMHIEGQHFLSFLGFLISTECPNKFGLITFKGFNYKNQHLLGHPVVLVGLLLLAFGKFPVQFNVVTL